MSKCSTIPLTIGFGIIYFFYIQQNHKQQQNKPVNTCSNNKNEKVKQQMNATMHAGNRSTYAVDTITDNL